MSSNKDSIQNIVTVALAVCLVAAVIVSGAAVSLKPARAANKLLDRNQNVLMAAGLFVKDETPASKVPELIAQFEVVLVDLKEGKILAPDEVDALGIDISKYEQRKAAKIPDLSEKLSKGIDIASISRRARYSTAYLLKESGALKTIVLPIHGYGLWSTLYGFVALKGDLNTVAGITFYEHGETAGLGGEVDNPVWKAGWKGKKVFKSDGSYSADFGEKVSLSVIKGKTIAGSQNIDYEVDGISGATLTSNGVSNLLGFWLGKNGFGPMLKSIKG